MLKRRVTSNFNYLRTRQTITEPRVLHYFELYEEVINTLLPLDTGFTVQLNSTMVHHRISCRSFRSGDSSLLIIPSTRTVGNSYCQLPYNQNRAERKIPQSLISCFLIRTLKLTSFVNYCLCQCRQGFVLLVFISVSSNCTVSFKKTSRQCHNTLYKSNIVCYRWTDVT